MGDFIYSINVTLPIFLVMVIGYLLYRCRLLNDNFVAVANKFNFNVTLPALLFRDMSATNFSEDFNLIFILFCVAATTIGFFVIWAGTKLFVKEKALHGAFVQASFRSSAAVLGIAFIQNLCGDSGMGPMMIIGSVPLYNILSVLVLTFEANEAGEFQNRGEKIRSACINILKNPIIISIAAGSAVSLLGLTFPVFVQKTVGNLAVMATPLTLIAIGAGFKGEMALGKIKPTFAATIIKLVAQPAFFMALAFFMPFNREEMVAILIMSAAPSTPSCYIMAKNMHNDEVLTSSIIVATTLVSAVTMTGWIFLLKYNGVI